MKPSLPPFARLAGLGLTIALVALAIGSSAIRFWLLPRLAAQRSELEDRIGGLVDERIRIGGLSAQMQGFAPELVLDDVRIVDATGKEGIRFEHIRLGVDPLKTLLSGQIAPAWVVIQGTRLSLRTKPDGNFTVLGLNISDRPPAWVLSAGNLELLDSRLDWQDLRGGGLPVDLGRADLRLVNSGDRHQLSASTILPGSEGDPVTLMLDARGDLFARDGWSGRMYLAASDLDAHRVAGLVPDNPGIRSGHLGFRLWSTWHRGQQRRLAGRIEVREPTIVVGNAGDSGGVLKLAAVEAWFRWSETAKRSLLDVSALRLAVTGEPAAPVHLTLAAERDDGGRTLLWRGRASRLHLEQLAAISRGLPVLPDALRDRLADLSPRGELREVSGIYRSEEGAAARIFVCAQLQDVSVKASGKLPGWTNIAGRICGTERQGDLDLQTRNGALDIPAWFAAPIQGDRVDFRAAWRRTGAIWRLDSDALTLQTPDFSANAHLRVELADDQPDAPLLDIGLSLVNAQIPALKRYLPHSLIPDTARYLDTSAVDGEITRAEIRFRGRPADFPFRQQEGVFEALVEGHKLEFAYSPSWPPLRAASARWRFAGPGMQVEVMEGRIGDGRLVSAKAAIPDLTEAPLLSVEGEVKATVTAVLGFLGQSPLRRIPAGLLQFADVGGDADISLRLAIPLAADAGATRVQGSANLSDGSVVVKRGNVAVRALHGVLNFTESGIAARDVVGTLASRPVTIAASQRDGAVVVEATGRAAVADVQGLLPGALLRTLRGETDYALRLELPEPMDPVRRPLRLSLRSGLQGVDVALPKPVGKPASVRSELALDAEIGGGATIPLHLSYGNELSASLEFAFDSAARPRLESGSIAWGRPLPTPGLEPGLSLFGHFGQLDLREWEKLAPSLSAEGGAILGERIRAVEFDAREVLCSAGSIGAVNLKLRREPLGWKGSVEGEPASGNFLLAETPGGPGSVQLDMNHLKIPEWLKAGKEGDWVRGLDPRSFPAVSLVSRQLFWRGLDAGRLSVDIERNPSGLAIRKAELRGTGYELSAAGDWLAGAGKPNVRLTGHASVENLGELAKRWAYPNRVLDTKTDIQFGLNWAGSPLGFEPAGLNGEVKLKLGEGSLLEIEPGWGRVLGFLNLNSIWRRLSLDFRDLFGKGLAYDGIEGVFTISDGRAATTDGLLIDGLTTRIVFQGSANFANKTLDQTVTVIPRTTAALPLAGTLAGGPAVGAAIYVAQELIGEQVDSITATRYSVKGDWNNPRVVKVDGNAPLDLLNRAWSGLKSWSGAGKESEGKKQ